jgi:hypothetical protein
MQNHISSEDSRDSQSLDIEKSKAQKQQRTVLMDENQRQKKVRQSNPVKLKIDHELPINIDPGKTSSDAQSTPLRDSSEQSYSVDIRDQEESDQKKLSVADHSETVSYPSKLPRISFKSCSDLSEIEHSHDLGMAIEQVRNDSTSLMFDSSVSQVQVGCNMSAWELSAFKHSYGYDTFVV